MLYNGSLSYRLVVRISLNWFGVSDRLVHGAVPLRHFGRVTDSRRNAGRRQYRPVVLCDTSLGATADTRPLDWWDNANLLRLQHRNWCPTGFGLLQHLQIQLLPVCWFNQLQFGPNLGYLVTGFHLERNNDGSKVGWWTMVQLGRLICDWLVVYTCISGTPWSHVWSTR